MLALIANHLWQSTLFACAAFLLTLALRNHRAQIRYGIWLAASIKFLVPFSLLISAGNLMEWKTAPAVAPPVSAAIEQIGQPFSLTETVSTPTPAPSFSKTGVLSVVWLCGSITVLSLWFIRWRRVRAIVKTATPVDVRADVRVLSAPSLLEPGVFGVFRPVLLLPEGIAARLAPAQLRAVLAHELCHVSRRDNLAAALHMLVEALFWFHPLVWWIGARLVEERERACDEEVLLQGSAPEVYAEGILNVCRHYLESPLPCVSGVSGANLKKRIEAIMKDRVSTKLTLARKLLLAVAGMTAVLGPVLIGVTQSRAQSNDEKLSFEVASIKPAEPEARNVGMNFTGDGLKITNLGLKQAIAFAYSIECGKSCDNVITGGPSWIATQRYDIIAKTSAVAPEIDVLKLTAAERRTLRDQVRLRLRTLLADRFQLVVRQEAKEMPVYALTVGKNGHKMKASTATNENSSMRGGRGEMIGENITMQFFCTALAGPLGRVVLDQTGLTGRYDFTLNYTPDSLGGGMKGPGGATDVAPPADPQGPTIFTALQEQLGLKVESTKGPVNTIAIERVEKPSEN